MTRIGDPVARPDGRDKVRGFAKFAADHYVDDALHAVYVPAAIAAGRVGPIDAASTLRHPGVETAAMKET